MMIVDTFVTSLMCCMLPLHTSNGMENFQTASAEELKIAIHIISGRMSGSLLGSGSAGSSIG